MDTNPDKPDNPDKTDTGKPYYGPEDWAKARAFSKAYHNYVIDIPYTFGKSLPDAVKNLFENVFPVFNKDHTEVMDGVNNVLKHLRDKRCISDAELKDLLDKSKASADDFKKMYKLKHKESMLL